MSHGTVHRYTLMRRREAQHRLAPGPPAPSATSPHPRLGGCAADARHPGPTRSRRRSPRLVTHQGKTRLVPVDAGPPHGSLLPTGLQLALPPIEPALPQAVPSAELADRYPAPRRLADHPLPVSCLLRVFLSLFIAHLPLGSVICAPRLSSCRSTVGGLSGGDLNRGRWVHRTGTDLALQLRTAVLSLGYGK